LVETNDTKQGIVCPNCGSQNIKQEFGEVYVCQQCQHKFNVHIQQKSSLKFALLGVLFLLGFGVFIKYSIQPFDREDAMQAWYDLMQNNSKESTIDATKNNNYQTNAAIVTATDNEVWNYQIKNNQAIILNCINLKNKETVKNITINSDEAIDINHTKLAATDNKILAIYNNQFSIIDINKKEITTNSSQVYATQAQLRQGVSRIEFIDYLPAIKIQNFDGNQFYYLIEKDKLISNQELEAIQKNTKINQSWLFEKVYIIANNKLFQVLKKAQEYMLPIAANDITEILSGNTWIKNVYQITNIQAIEIASDLSNTTIIAQNESEILLYNSNLHKITYYNINNKNIWDREITVNIDSDVKGKIAQEIIIYHQKNTFTFNKSNGALISKY
jgi:DNA-directed RNA polymerase subunit RPC12/RpoP